MTYRDAGRLTTLGTLGALLLWSGVYTYQSLAARARYPAGWDFNMDGAFTIRDALSYLQYNVCAPVHFVLWSLPHPLQTFFEVGEMRPLSGNAVTAGAILWLCVLCGCFYAGWAVTDFLFWREERQQMRAARERGRARRAVLEREREGEY
jgi:hypothetical protein